MNFRKGETEEQRLNRILGRKRVPVAPPRRGIDSDAPMYVEAVAKARESGKLYEGLDMATAIIRARTDNLQKKRLTKWGV